MKFTHVAQRIFNQPVAIVPQKAEIIISALADRLGVGFIEGRPVKIGAMEDDDWGEPAARRKGYDIVDGVALIQVEGTLIHKNGTLRPSSGMTGYDGIRANLNTAMADDLVKAIAFDIDSGGGEVAGCFDLVDSIYSMRGQKPMMAILTECAYSAAYAIASATDFIAVPRTGGTGSVGVIAMHVDYSAALEKAGLNVTLIHYGKRKALASETKPLSSEAMDWLQSEVDKTGELFVETVARNRKLSKKKVRETEAGLFIGESGVEVGFADKVMSPDEALDALLAMVE